LENVKAEDVLAWMKDGALIEVTNEYTLASCVSVLAESKILSVPVKDVKSQKYIGFVDMMDIAAATVDVEETSGVLQKLEKEDQKKKKTSEEELQDVDRDDTEPNEMEESFMMASLDAKSISDISCRDPFLHVNSNDSVLEAAKLLTKHHRIGVMEGDKLRGIISQSGLTEYISEEHADLFQKLASKVTLKDLSLPSEIHSINYNARAIQAFKMMRDKGVSGLAVVADNDTFLDVVSVSDIMIWVEWILGGQTVRFTNLSNLRKSVKDFLEDSRTQRNVPKKGNLNIEKKTKLVDAVGCLQMNNIHRLFVIEDDRAISVLNYNNIIEYLIK